METGVIRILVQITMAYVGHRWITSNCIFRGASFPESSRRLKYIVGLVSAPPKDFYLKIVNNRLITGGLNQRKAIDQLFPK